MSFAFKFYPFTRIYKRHVSELMHALVDASVGTGFVLLFSNHAPWWAFVLLCWCFGAATLPFTWRPKPDDKDWNSRTFHEVLLYAGLIVTPVVLLIVFGALWWLPVSYFLGCVGIVIWCWRKGWAEHYKDEVVASLMLGYLYLMQAVILSAYRFFQLVQDPYKLWKMAPEIRARADIMTNEDAYFEENALREWQLRAEGEHFIIRERQLSPMGRFIMWLNKSGGIIEIKFEDGNGLTPQQQRQLRYRSDHHVIKTWSGSSVSGEGKDQRFVKTSFDLRRGYYHLKEVDAKMLANQIEDVRKFQGERRSSDRSIDVNPDNDN